VSLKADYAIKALVRPALATESEPGQAHDVAGFVVSPTRFLDQVRHNLRPAGYVHSKRRKRGGDLLARTA
jgi:DNA-binding IscR family transcriptional regulator